MHMEKRSLLSQFWGSVAFAVLATIGGGIFGGLQGGLAGAFNAMMVIVILGVLETSLSLDNAVVNAKILHNWSPFWRKIFLTVGILIAVFGMRAVFPIVIVAVAGSMSMGDTVKLALTDPTAYGHKLHEIHYLVAGFGGAFLMMVALAFFLAEKQAYWWEWAEKKLEVAGSIGEIKSVLTLGTVLGVSFFTQHQAEFFMAGFWGWLTYCIAHGLSSLLEEKNEDDEPQATIGSTAVKVATGGSIAGFMYLELLDASFSFDGVIGAFAITTVLWQIVLGLSIGAFFVRSMTVYLVNEGTLAELRYLEHGAFAAIAVLVGIMFVSGTGIEIPEVVSGLSGAALIGIAIWRSIRVNKAEKLAHGLA